jgi:hypothetical protein
VIERLLHIKDHLIRILDELKWDGIQASQWLILEGVSNLLDPFAKINELARAEKYPTISGVRAHYKFLDYHLNQVIEGKYVE